MNTISIRQLRALFGALALLCTLGAQARAAAYPMTYQGRLKDSGLPVSGNKNIDILICNCLSGACAPACASSGVQGVTVSSGLFRTTFTVPASVDLSASQQWFLEVQVGGTPLAPREQMTVAPFAVYAATASGLVAASGAPGVNVSTPVYFTGLPSASTQELFRLTKTSFGGSIFKQYYDPSTAYGLQIVGTEAQVVLVTDTGASPPRVGIGGVLLPKTNLDVNGDAQFGTGTAKSTFTTTGNLQLVSGSTITSNGTFSISTAASAALTGVPAIFINKSGQVGIGTTSPEAALHAVGVSSFTTSITVNGVEFAFVPRGMVSFFNLAACPSGWTALVAAEGRYVVGKPAAGTLAGTVGTALTDLENRPVGQHNHTITDPGHNHTFNGASSSGGASPTATPQGFLNFSAVATANNSTGISINNAGAVAGTNAPYIQLLACQKN